MPGYVIHLAIAKKQLEQGKINDVEEYIRGTMAPDLLKRQGIDSHYGYSSNPGFKQFFREHTIENDYEKGYFLHLVTDYLFYNKFIDLEKWTPDLYRDYDALNKPIVQMYGIDLPEEVRDETQFCDETPQMLKLEDVVSFIDTVGKMDLEEIYKKMIKKMRQSEEKDKRRKTGEIEKVFDDMF